MNKLYALNKNGAAERLTRPRFVNHSGMLSAWQRSARVAICASAQFRHARVRIAALASLGVLLAATLGTGCNMDTADGKDDAAGGSSAAGGSKVSSGTSAAGGTRVQGGDDSTKGASAGGSSNGNDGAAGRNAAAGGSAATHAGGSSDATQGHAGGGTSGTGLRADGGSDSGAATPAAGGSKAPSGGTPDGGAKDTNTSARDGGTKDSAPAVDGSRASAEAGTSAGACGERPTGSILPFVTGYRWTYDVTDAEDGTTTEKTTEIQDKEAVGYGDSKDALVHKVLTTKKSGTDKTLSWQELVGDSVVRYREDSYSKKDGSLTETDYWTPYRLHADGTAAHTVNGATWTDAYAETKMPVGEATEGPEQTSDKWMVVSDYECIDVPAGTGPNGPIAAGKFAAVKFDKTTPKGKTKSYWYVRGIGKVREVSAEQTEQLTGFTLTAK